MNSEISQPPVRHPAPHGPPPYGYRRAQEGGWEADPEEAPYLALLFAAMLRGDKTITEVTALANSQDWPAPRGAEWTRQSVRHILSSRVYEGLVFRGEWVIGAQPALVSGAEAAAVRTLLSKRRRGETAGYQEIEAALFGGGLLRCPLCAEQGISSILYATSQPIRKYRNGTLCGPYRRYVCSQFHKNSARRNVRLSLSTDWHCPGFRVSEEIARALLFDALVWHGLSDLADSLSGQENVQEVREALAEVLDYAIPSPDKRGMNLALRSPTLP